jgi:hypothetical protein
LSFKAGSQIFRISEELSAEQRPDWAPPNWTGWRQSPPWVAVGYLQARPIQLTALRSNLGHSRAISDGQKAEGPLSGSWSYLSNG